MRRDTYLPAKDTQKPLRSPRYEAAKFLASAARRFMEERTTENEIDDAIEAWWQATDRPLRRAP